MKNLIQGLVLCASFSLIACGVSNPSSPGKLTVTEKDLKEAYCRTSDDSKIAPSAEALVMLDWNTRQSGIILASDSESLQNFQVPENSDAKIYQDSQKLPENMKPVEAASFAKVQKALSLTCKNNPQLVLFTEIENLSINCGTKDSLTSEQLGVLTNFNLVANLKICGNTKITHPNLVLVAKNLDLSNAQSIEVGSKSKVAIRSNSVQVQQGLKLSVEAESSLSIVIVK